MFCKKASFYGEDLSTPFLTSKLEYHPLSAVCDCLFNILYEMDSIISNILVKDKNLRKFLESRLLSSTILICFVHYQVIF